MTRCSAGPSGIWTLEGLQNTTDASWRRSSETAPPAVVAGCLRNGFSRVASCLCAFRIGQRRRVDRLDDLHPAVYRAPLDSKRTQPNCFERGQRNPHGLEQAASGAPEDGHSPIVLVGDGKPSTGDRSQGPNPKFGFRVSQDGTYRQAPTRRRHRCHCPGWSFTARRAGRFQDLPVPPSHGRPRAERVFISRG